VATICGFGTAPEQKEEGYKGIGTINGTDDEVLAQFFSDDVRLVRGGEINNSSSYEFFVMVKQEEAHGTLRSMDPGRKGR